MRRPHVASSGPVAKASVGETLPAASALATPARASVQLFAFATFLSAFLLFWLEPMVAKLLLPGLGGAAAVWAVCLVFFQSALLAGYAYAHVARTLLSSRQQLGLHVAFLLAALFTMPLQLDVTMAPPQGSEPALWLLGRLLWAVAPVFVVAAASGPLLQGWFSQSGRDPYFLYAASNLGSAAALLLFPLCIEPSLDLEWQKQGWSVGFLSLGVLTAVCGWSLPDAPPVPVATGMISWRAKRLWLLLSLVPSALLVGATNYISTDVAALPLLWVVPLALYLLSFVHAFAPRPWLKVEHTVILATVALAVLATFPQLGFGAPSLALRVALHCAALFAASLALHGRLSALRPAPEQLSTYYLWISLGGALGGILCALIAPWIFSSGLEYPIAIVAVTLLLPERAPSPQIAATPSEAPQARAATRGRGKSRTKSAAAAVTSAAVQTKVGSAPAAEATGSLSRTLDYVAPLAVLLLVWSSKNTSMPAALVGWSTLGLVLLGIYSRPRLAAMIAILFVGRTLLNSEDNVLHRSRNFFGTLVVRDLSDMRVLMHGTTQHGGQSKQPQRRTQPLAYFHPYGPVGRLLMEHGGKSLTAEVGVVGLGVGSLVSYAMPQDRWTYFEIDPAVIKVAQDPALFTLVSEAAVKPRIIEGDARLSLANEPDGRFSLLILDAFTSDAIPLHLLTREAFQLYRQKLRPDGVMMIHISNRNVDLAPIIARTARAMNLPIRRAHDDDERGHDPADWKRASEWVFVSMDSGGLRWLKGLPLWEVPMASPGEPWSDRSSNLLEALR